MIISNRAPADFRTRRTMTAHPTMVQEMKALEDDFRAVDESCGENVLNLTLAQMCGSPNSCAATIRISSPNSNLSRQQKRCDCAATQIPQRQIAGLQVVRCFGASLDTLVGFAHRLLVQP